MSNITPSDEELKRRRRRNSIALGLVLRTIVTLIWSAQTRYPAQYLGQFGRPVELLPGVSISGIDLLIIGAAVLGLSMAGIVLVTDVVLMRWCSSRSRVWHLSSTA